MAHTILIADADVQAASTLKMRLQEKGYNVLYTSDAADTLYVIFTRSPDLIVLDIDLPECGGLAILRGLRAVSATSNLPVIVTGNALDDNTIFQACALGADAKFDMPLHVEYLLAFVEQVFRPAESAKGPKVYSKCVRVRYRRGGE